MITGSLCHAARALVEVSRRKLALVSGIDEKVITDFELRLARPDEATVRTLKECLEDLGAVFLDEDHRGAGVRIKFTESERRRIATLEDEGGPIRHDDVP